MAALPKEQRLAVLRDRIASVAGGVGAIDSMPAGPVEQAPADSVLASADEGGVSGVVGPGMLDVPGGIGRLLPRGGLVGGSVVECRGSGVMAGLLAAVTGTGRWSAVVGDQRLGLLAVQEMGGDLGRLAVIDPGSDGRVVAEVAGVVVEGMALVVIDVTTTIPVAAARSLVARVRAQGAVLVMSSRVQGVRADLTLDSEPCRYSGIGRGRGRVREIRLAVRVSGRGLRPRSGELCLAPADDGVQTEWTRTDGAVAAPTPLERVV
ncbi:hypothetical protein [Nocardia nova]|uniref:hypothetical protein n=1 Tax=Nocardia nova TaxID=37330 RepID=UPI003402F126